LLEDIRLVRQRCDWASVELDDVAVADLFDEQVDFGRRPEEFGRIWVHTHPGESARPSATDEATFSRVFGGCEWAVMLIVARGGQCYARLTFAGGPGGSFEIPVEVDYDAPFPASDHAAWQMEYDTCVEQLLAPKRSDDAFDFSQEDSRQLESFDWFGAYDQRDLEYLREGDRAD
jgi:hypothetical protein